MILCFRFMAALQNDLQAESIAEIAGVYCKVLTSSGSVLYEGKGSLEGGDNACSPPPPSRRQTIKERLGALYPFAIISVSYLLFTITDGAVHMIVLLHGKKYALA